MFYLIQWNWREFRNLIILDGVDKFGRILLFSESYWSSRKNFKTDKWQIYTYGKALSISEKVGKAENEFRQTSCKAIQVRWDVGLELRLDKYRKEIDLGFFLCKIPLLNYMNSKSSFLTFIIPLLKVYHKARNKACDLH